MKKLLMFVIAVSFIGVVHAGPPQPIDEGRVFYVNEPGAEKIDAEVGDIIRIVELGSTIPNASQLTVQSFDATKLLKIAEHPLSKEQLVSGPSLNKAVYFKAVNTGNADILFEIKNWRNQLAIAPSQLIEIH